MNLRTTAAQIVPDDAARLEELLAVRDAAKLTYDAAKAAVEAAEAQILPVVSRWLRDHTSTPTEESNPGCVRLGEPGCAILRTHHGWGHPDRTVAVVLPHTQSEDVITVAFETLMLEDNGGFHWYSERHRYSMVAGMFVTRAAVPEMRDEILGLPRREV